jgi:hypothetical protein
MMSDPIDPLDKIIPLPEPANRNHPVGLEVVKRRLDGRALAPGLVGEIAEFTTATAMYPSTKFAIATGLGIVGTLISRRIAGPSGPRGVGTHLYQALIAQTANGKEHVRTAGKFLLQTANAGGLIGPGRFKSGAGIVKYVVHHPVSLCFQDELGAAMFARLADPKISANERDLSEVLRELWGINFGRYDSPAGALDEAKAVMAPALSLIGMTTPKELYRACRSQDIANGFLNRFMFVEEKEALPYQDVPESELEVPHHLLRHLLELHQPGVQIDATGKPPVRLGWGPGAKEIYEEFREATRKEPDERKRDLLARSPEKVVRVATILAAGRFANAVSREDMEWARGWVSESDATLFAGVMEYMEEEKLEFGELCKEIIRRIHHNGRMMTRRDLGRSFQGNVRYKKDLKEALMHLVETEQLIYGKDQSPMGRPAEVFSLPTVEPPPPDPTLADIGLASTPSTPKSTLNIRRRV